jgi:hypothetical protein
VVLYRLISWLARFAELLIGPARWFRRQQIGVSFDPTRGYFTTGSESASANSRIELGLRPSTHPSLRRLLRLRRKRPRRRGAEQRDELAPSHAVHGLPLPVDLPHHQPTIDPVAGPCGRPESF